MVSRIPPELLDKIVAEIIPATLSELTGDSDSSGFTSDGDLDEREMYQVPDWHLSGEDWHQALHGELKSLQRFSRAHTSLLPLLTVSKLWHDISEHHLYRSVTLEESTRPGSLEAFLATLTRNVRIAGLVRELRIRHHAWQTEKTEAAIIAECVALERLTIVASSGLEFEAFPQAVRNLRGLISLIFVRVENPFGLIGPGVNPTPICSPGELIELLAVWPEMEYIAILDTVWGEESETDASIKEIIAQGTVLCPRLRFFCARKWFTANQVRALATIAPALTSLDIEMDADDNVNVPALVEVLPVWASTLEYLAIRYDYDARPDCTIPVSLCKQLSGVTELRVQARLVPPKLLVHFTNVVRLNYLSVSAENVEALVHFIPSMKNLKTLHLRVPDDEPTDPGVEAIDAICDSQGIDMTCLTNYWEAENL